MSMCPLLCVPILICLTLKGSLLDRGQIVDFGETGPVRCAAPLCKGYINPFMKFIDQGRRFICNLCGKLFRSIHSCVLINISGLSLCILLIMVVSRV